MALGTNTKRWLSRTVTALAFVAGVALFWRLWLSYGPSFLALELTWTDIGIMALLPLPAYIVIIARTMVLLRSVGSPAPVGALTAINLSSQAVGSLLPGGVLTELGFRALFFVRSGLAAETSILVNAADGLVRYIVNAALLFFTAIYFVLFNVFDETARVTVLLGLALSLIGLTILAGALFGGLDAWFIKTARQMSQAGNTGSIASVTDQRFSDFLGRHKRAVGWAAAWSAIGFILEPLQLWALLAIAGIPLPLWAVFWLTQALALPRILPVPGAVGVAEESGIQFARLIGQDVSVGFFASILWRVRMLPWIFVGLLLLPFLALFRLAPITVDGLPPTAKKQ